MTQAKWSFGDEVINTSAPEWGTGHITSAKDMKGTDGSPCQRLQIRFANAGLKTLTTEHARLESPASGSAPTPAENAEPLHAEDTPLEDRLLNIPMRCRDPFNPPAERLAATFRLFEFDTSPRSLLDWATTMTGLSDPLTEFNRHQLEEAFTRFERTLAAYARELVGDLKRKDPRAVDIAIKSAPDRARRVLLGRGA